MPSPWLVLHVLIKIPVSPGPGRVIRNMLGWSQLEKTARIDGMVDRTAQRGRSLVIPHAPVRMRMGGAQLESGAGHC